MQNEVCKYDSKENHEPENSVLRWIRCQYILVEKVVPKVVAARNVLGTKGRRVSALQKEL